MTAPAPYPLTGRQLEVLRFIAGYVECFGIAPSRSEIGEGLGMVGKGSVQRVIDRLEERGWIRRLRHRDRAIELLHVPTVPRSPTGAPLHFVQPKGLLHG